MEQNDVNYVEVIGKILKIYMAKPGRCLITVRCGHNTPEFFCVDDNAEYAKGLKIGDNVMIVANIQSSYKPKLNKNVSTYFVNRIIKLPDKSYAECYRNEFYIRGKIKAVYLLDKSRIARIFIETNVNGHKSVFPISYYDYEESVIEAMQLETKLDCCGMIQTMKKTIDDITVYYQNPVIKMPTHKIKTA